MNRLPFLFAILVLVLAVVITVVTGEYFGAAIIIGSAATVAITTRDGWR